MEDSCFDLRRQLGDDDSTPVSIRFSQGREISIETNCFSLALAGQTRIS
jgi:hypothetical protein